MPGPILRRAVVVLMVVLAGLAWRHGSGPEATAAAPTPWVNDTKYGSAGGGFYWDTASEQVWTAERGWHYFDPQPPRPHLPLWVDYLNYGSAGGGFYWDPLSGKVWTSERGWHFFDPKPGGATPPTQAAACTATAGGPGTRLTAVANGLLVDDTNQGLCWLADANLAGDASVRAQVQLSSSNLDGSTPVIYPDGAMDYETSLNWVASLNRYNNGKGWLGHSNWQLPATPLTDPSCSSINQGNFGALCSRSAFGSLYTQGLGLNYPASSAPGGGAAVEPFHNLQPGLYWTATANTGGQGTFSFNTGDDGANTTNFNFLHVLPMTRDSLGQHPSSASACSVVPYTSGPGAGIAVFDSCTGLSWPADANLAATNRFGFSATTVLDTARTNAVNHTAFPMTVPMINDNGTVFYDAISPSATNSWIASMNAANFAASNRWALPSGPIGRQAGDLDVLYHDLQLQAGDTRLQLASTVGPFANLQPGFYWACERHDDTGARGPCDPSLSPGGPNFAWSFNFDDGFQGTDHLDKHFYVMVYYPMTVP